MERDAVFGSEGSLYSGFLTLFPALFVFVHWAVIIPLWQKAFHVSLCPKFSIILRSGFSSGFRECHAV